MVGLPEAEQDRTHPYGRYKADWGWEELDEPGLFSIDHAENSS